MKQTSQYFKTALLALVAITNFTLNASAQIQKGFDIYGSAKGDLFGMSVCMPDANTIAIGAPENNDTGDRAGYVRIYTWTVSNWIQKGLDIIGESAGDEAGFSVSMPDANTVAIGARSNTGNGLWAGHVRVYSWNGSAWTQRGADIDGEAAGDVSGISVSMPDANTVAIGAYSNSETGYKAGHVRIYSWDDEWIQKGIDIDGLSANDYSGLSVSMPDANTLAIGAPGKDASGTDPGYVRVFTWNGNTWIQKGLNINGEAGSDYSGTSVSMPDVNTVAIGAPGNYGNGLNAGHVRVYTWNGSTWFQKGLDIDGESAGDGTGNTVSMPDANTVAIGAPYNSANGTWVGHVRIFTWNGNAWTQLGINIEGQGDYNYFGRSVSMPDANTVAIGTTGINSLTGQVQVYNLTTVGIIENSFTETFAIFPNPTTGQLFIHFDAVQDELNVSLYTLDGKLLEANSTKNASNYSYEIKAPAGIYLLKIFNKHQEATVRVVKE